MEQLRYGPMAATIYVLMDIQQPVVQIQQASGELVTYTKAQVGILMKAWLHLMDLLGLKLHRLLGLQLIGLVQLLLAALLTLYG